MNGIPTMRGAERIFLVPVGLTGDHIYHANLDCINCLPLQLSIEALYGIVLVGYDIFSSEDYKICVHIYIYIPERNHIGPTLYTYDLGCLTVLSIRELKRNACLLRPCRQLLTCSCWRYCWFSYIYIYICTHVCFILGLIVRICFYTQILTYMCTYVYMGMYMCAYVHTQRLQCSSFLAMTYFLLRDYNILSKKEPHSSPWVYRCMHLCG